MSFLNTSRKPVSNVPTRRSRTAGLSLVEVMVAATLLTLGGICLISAITQAYRMASLIRYENQARYILRSVSDQFLLSGPTNPMLAPAATYTGVGLAWDGDLQIFCYESDAIAKDHPAVDAIGTTNGLVIQMGNIRAYAEAVPSGIDPVTNIAFTGVAHPEIRTSAPLAATITRRVTINTSANAIGAGQIYQADFKAKFRFLNKDRELVTTVVRTIE